MTEVDAAVVYEFENGLKSLEFVASYIHASIFKSAVPGVFEISWSETLDGEYTPFTASDIKYTREKIGDDYVPGDPENEAIGNQYLAYYNIENIPAQARYIKLFFKGSDPEAEYPFNYANWQAPLGYLEGGGLQENRGYRREQDPDRRRHRHPGDRRSAQGRGAGRHR